MPDSIQAVARKVAASLEPLARALGRDDSSIIGFVEQLGWTLPSVPQALKALGVTAARISDTYRSLELGASVEAAGGTVTVDVAAKYVELAAGVVSLISELGDLPSSLQSELGAAFVAATDFPHKFAVRLLDLCTYELVQRTTTRIEPILRLLGIVEVVQEPADAAKFQPAYLRRTIHWDRLGMLLGNPTALMKDVYGWGTAAFNGTAVLDALMHLSFALAGPASLDWPTPARIQALTGTLPAFEDVGPPQIVISFLEHDSLSAGISVLPLPASGGALPGVALGLFSTGAVPAMITLSDLLSLQLDGPTSLNAGLSVALRPGQAPKARIGLEGSGDSPLGEARIGATLKVSRSTPMSLLALPGGSSLDAAAVTVSAGVTVQPKGPEPFLDVGITGGKITLSLGGTDGFLQKILPGGPMELDFEVGITWTPSGLALRGGGALTLAIPLHQQVGPLSIDTLYLAGTLNNSGLQLEVSVAGGASLGPINVAVDRVGLQATLALSRGNLGPLDLGVGFKPPTGVGLSIDAGVVQGGGFLYIDTARGEYAGALQLTIADFLSVSAIGLINTKMPDGTPGFSLLIIITADFGAGIELGFGFTLNAVGGLLGLNRSMLFQPLMDGVRSGAIDNIMFPRDIIANAPRIISDLRAIFPPQQGTFLIGPMLKLGWGEPTLITLSLGVIIEIPPADIAILGVLRAALPADDVAILVLQVNFAGALEFSKQRLYFFASLFDSHILFITIEGEMGLLFAWGDNANFVVSIGGFHPQFNPPPLPFPTPRRIAVDIINESYARIHSDGYFAVTTNTVQFGAHSEFFFGFDALNVNGHSSFDALIQFSPFHFTVQISTSFSVEVFGIGVYGVGIDLTVEGPAPWHVHGTASLSFFFFSISIGIDFTFGDAPNTTLPPIAIMPIVAGEYAKQSNWKAVLPAGSNLLVSLRALAPAESQFVLHPVGTLQVSQRTIPLDLTLDMVGGQKPSDANRLVLSVTSADLVKARDLQESFAPAQFKNLDDATKLSQPAYAPQDGGIELAAAANVFGSGTAICRIVRYDVTIIDTKLLRAVSRFVRYAGSLFQLGLRRNAASKSALSALGDSLAHPFDEAVKLSAETFAVAMVADNTVFRPEAATFTSRSSARDYLERATTADPSLHGTLHVLPQFEVAA